MSFLPPQNYIVFDGAPLTDFGVYVSGEGTFLSPERDYDITEIPGKNGDLYFDRGRFKNVEVKYPSFILEHLRKNMSGLRSYMLKKHGYLRLEDTYHPEEYRLAVFKGPIEPDDVIWLQAGKFDLTFDCKPQRWLKVGEQPIELTSTTNIYNPTDFDAKPLLRVYGKGALGVGSNTLTIAQHSNAYIDIDCDLMDCYCGTTNCNSLITLSSGNFPVLEPGAHGISLGTGITKVIVWPRWWKV